MRNNRIKKHSHGQTQQSFEGVISLSLTHKQKSYLNACGVLRLQIHLQALQRGA